MTYDNLYYLDTMESPAAIQILLQNNNKYFSTRIVILNLFFGGVIIIINNVNVKYMDDKITKFAIFFINSAIIFLFL